MQAVVSDVHYSDKTRDPADIRAVGIPAVSSSSGLSTDREAQAVSALQLQVPWGQEEGRPLVQRGHGVGVSPVGANRVITGSERHLGTVVCRCGAGTGTDYSTPHSMFPIQGSPILEDRSVIYLLKTKIQILLREEPAAQTSLGLAEGDGRSF